MYADPFAEVSDVLVVGLLFCFCHIGMLRVTRKLPIACIAFKHYTVLLVQKDNN